MANIWQIISDCAHVGGNVIGAIWNEFLKDSWYIIQKLMDIDYLIVDFIWRFCTGQRRANMTWSEDFTETISHIWMLMGFILEAIGWFLDEVNNGIIFWIHYVIDRITGDSSKIITTNWLFFTNQISVILISFFIIILGILVPNKAKIIKFLNLISAFYLLIFFYLIFNTSSVIYLDGFYSIFSLYYSSYVNFFFIIATLTAIIFFLSICDIFYLEENMKIEYTLLVFYIYLSALLLISSLDFISIIILLECIAFSSYVLVGFERNNKFSTSSALKYLILAAIPSGFFILGASILYNNYGSFFQDCLSLLLKSYLPLDVPSEHFYNELLGLINVEPVFIQDISSFKYKCAASVNWYAHEVNLILSKFHFAQIVIFLSQLELILWINAQDIISNLSVDVMGSEGYPSVVEPIEETFFARMFIKYNVDLAVLSELTKTKSISFCEVYIQLFMYYYYVLELIGSFYQSNTILYHMATSVDKYPNTMPTIIQGVTNEFLFVIDSWFDKKTNYINKFFGFLSYYVFFTKKLSCEGVECLKLNVSNTAAIQLINKKYLFEDTEWTTAFISDKITFITEWNVGNARYDNKKRLLNIMKYILNYIDYINHLITANFFTETETPKFVLYLQQLVSSTVMPYFIFNQAWKIWMESLLNDIHDLILWDILEYNNPNNDPITQSWRVLTMADEYSAYNTNNKEWKNFHNIFLSTYLVIIFILINLSFKITAAPFHFWAPSVYGGSPLPTITFLSIFSKLTIIFLLINLFFTVFHHLLNILQPILFFLGVFSIIVSIIGAFSEKLFKRFFIYSSIGHVGFMILGIAVIDSSGIQGSIDYLILYIISSFIVWFIVMHLTKKTTHLISFKGLSFNYPTLSLILVIALFSISGLPPMAGFFVKFEIFYSLINSSQYFIAYFLFILTVFSFFYYLRLIKIIYFEDNKVIKKNKNLNDIKLRIISILIFILPLYALLIQEPFYYILKNLIQNTF